MNNIKEYSHHLFAVPIWGFYLNTEQYHAADYISKILEMKKNEESVKKSNFGGWQSRDDLNTTEGIFKEFVGILNNLSKEIGNEYFKGDLAGNIEVQEMWANVNYKYSYNAGHTHSGILSGAFYLQVPPNSGDLILMNPAVRSDTSVLRTKDYNIKPEKLLCVLFPSWLEHYVEQSLSDEERISISFNIGIKGENAIY